MSEAYNKSKILESQSKLDLVLAGIEARQMERSAIGVENQGVRAAQIEQQKTRTVTSDAVAAMAAGGGGVDPEMLRRIKQQGDYNSMSAIFDARTKAIDLRYQASMTRIGARYDVGASKRYGDSLKREATTGAIFNSMDMFAKAYSPKKTKLPTGTERF
jgi:predicted PilT family ATPase